MARIRSVKPELRTSLTAAEWPREVRYLWVLLWGYLDDHGRGVDNARLVLADCFPLDRDIDETIIDTWLDLIAAPRSEFETGPLCRYAVGGRRYMHATNWREHQKPSHPTDSRIPPCPVHDVAMTSRDTFANSSGNAPEGFANPSGSTPEALRPEQVIGDVVREVDGEGDVGASAPAPDPGFEDFWHHWPKKINKVDAEKAFAKAVTKKRHNPAAIVAGCVAYAERCRLVRQDPNFIPNPSTWLNGERWLNNLDEAMPLPSARSPAPSYQGFQDHDPSGFGSPKRAAT